MSEREADGQLVGLSQSGSIRVLNLVTNDEAQFFRQQVSVLEERGVSASTVAVPGDRHTTDGSTDSRSITDYLRFYPKVLEYSRDEYDLVHANYGLTAPAALAQPIRPIVLTFWGSDLLGSFGWVSRTCAQYADAVIVRSDEMASALEPISCYVIPHGVDLDRFRPDDRREARKRVGWAVDGYHVLFPYSKSRDVKDFPRAQAVIERTNARFDGNIQLHSVSGVPHHRIPDYMNAANALLFTSKHEGSPNAVKEAAACNLPVVSTDVGDVRTILDGVSPSMVCESDDELVAALLDVLEQNDRSNGRARIDAQYSLDEMGNRIREVYESVL